MNKYSLSNIYKLYLQHPKISIDSRNIDKGCIFFALKGDKFNANLFAAEAIEKGAAYAVIDKEDLPENDHFVVVDNVLETLQQLALMHRKQLKIPVLGITGSNGKTTTKELVYCVLAKKYKVYSTPGNLNNHIGLPFSILQIDNSYEIAVLEFGANHQQENEFLCSIALPDHGIMTNIGKDHLGGFGGFEGVVKAYSEFTDYFNSHQDYTFFMNTDDVKIPGLLSTKNIITYGIHDINADCRGIVTNSSLQTEVEIKSKQAVHEKHVMKIKSNLFGEFNSYNILAAVCIGWYFKVPDDKIKEAIEAYIPQNNRSQVIQKESNTFIFDAYNANPSSMKLAVDSFSDLGTKNKILILGEMYELGEESDKEHLELVNYLKSFNFNKVILVGKDFSKPSNLISCHYFDDYNGLKNWFSGLEFKNTTFLIKGSRGVKLEKAFEFYI